MNGMYRSLCSHIPCTICTMPFGAVIGSQIMMLSASPSDGEAIFSLLKVACLVYVMIFRHHQKCAICIFNRHITNK